MEQNVRAQAAHSKSAGRVPVAGLWVAAGAALLLFGGQTAWAGREDVTVRFVIAAVVLVGALLVLRALSGSRFLPTHDDVPDPVNLVVSALAALSIWPVAWWVMAVLDDVLRAMRGPRPVPHLLEDMHDSLLGQNLQPAAYELLVLFAVVVLPLVSAPLLWGAVRRSSMALAGPRRGVWLGGLVAGAFLALSAVQNVSYSVPLGFVVADGQELVVRDITPALLWGAVAIAGYVALGLVATWCAHLARSFWAGYAAHGAFVYANFALRDDLARGMQGRALTDVAWLTLLVLGLFGAFFCLQVIRFRRAGLAADSDSSRGLTTHDEPAQATASTAAAGPGEVAPVHWLPVGLLLVALVGLVALDLNGRADSHETSQTSRAVETVPDQYFDGAGEPDITGGA